MNMHNMDSHVTEHDGSQRPVCVICNAKLSNSSLEPAKLKEHFLKLVEMGNTRTQGEDSQIGWKHSSAC